MAVAVAREPSKYPCDTCDCIDGRSRDGVKWKIPKAGIESEVCLRQLVTQRSWLYIELYRHYQNGILAVAGGMLDQPYAYYRAMTVIDEWMRRDGRPESNSRSRS